MEMFGLVLAILIGCVLLVLPYFIARNKNHPQTVAIGVLSFMAFITAFIYVGWILWVVALVWSLTNPEPRTSRANPNSPVNIQIVNQPSGTAAVTQNEAVVNEAQADIEAALGVNRSVTYCRACGLGHTSGERRCERCKERLV